MRPVEGRPDYFYTDEELREVVRDAYVSWRVSRLLSALAICRQTNVGARGR